MIKSQSDTDRVSRSVTVSKIRYTCLIYDDNKVKLIRLLTQQHLLTVSVRYTQGICMVSSASLSRKVQNEWCSCNNHTFVCNFAKC